MLGRPLPIGPQRHVPAISWGQLGPRAAGGARAAAGRAVAGCQAGGRALPPRPPPSPAGGWACSRSPFI